jgi:glycosyltransferase involved in cell wall biosynthesis
VIERSGPQMRVWLLQRAEPTPHDDNGAQRLLRTGILARTLVRAGHQVTWWTSSFDHYNRRQRFDADCLVEVEPGYDIRYLYGPSYRRTLSFQRLRNHRSVARRFSALADQIDPRPDVLVASVPTTELALAAVRFGRRAGIPVVLDIRDLWPDVFFDVLPAFLKPVIELLAAPMRRSLRETSRDATAIIGLTDGFVDWGLSHSDRVRGPRDRVFFMGYPGKTKPTTELTAAREHWDHLGVTEDPNVVTLAFIGTLGFTVDFGPVIQAARLLHAAGTPVRFVICGDGARRAKIQADADGLPNIVFPGWIREDAIHALLERSAIGLTPYIASKNYLLNLPNKPAEYMAGGLAIANSLPEGELFNLLSARECGFSYRGDGTVLANQLTELVENPENLARLRKHARATFTELLNGESVYHDMVTYLEGLAGDSRPPDGSRGTS